MVLVEFLSVRLGDHDIHTSRVVAHHFSLEKS